MRDLGVVGERVEKGVEEDETVQVAAEGGE
jgi:hypothetical protein